MPSITIGTDTYTADMAIFKEATGDQYAFYKYIGSGYISDTLPAGYTAIPYVISDLNSYFMTDYVGKLDSWFKTKVEYTQFKGSGKDNIFSDRSTNGSGLKLNSTAAVGYNKGQSFSSAQSFSINTVYEIQAYKNNDLKINDLTITAASGNKTNTNVFSVGESNTAIVGHIYYLQIWEGEALVRNFLPCINDQNVVGFYETVTGTFYQSAGTAYTAP